MVIQRTDYIRIDWVDANNGLVTLVAEDGESQRTVMLNGGYCRSELGRSLFNLLNP